MQQGELDRLVSETSGLIACRPLTGSEHEAGRYFVRLFEQEGWTVETQDVGDGRLNLFVSWGVPQIVFTTHYDVVPAAAHQFTPRVQDGHLFGRGACDALGIAATMIAVCRRLRFSNTANVGLLLVVGEEVDGIGAKAAAQWLQGRGISYLVNGEPTESKLARAHKGYVDFRLTVTGQACHSGYPERGDDAIKRLARLITRLYDTSWGVDDTLGKGTITVGMVEGGVAANVVPAHAEAHGSMRLVSPVSEITRLVETIVGTEARVSFERGSDPITLCTVPGLEECVVAFFTDIPHFEPLGVPCLLFGPGSIFDAHTIDERISYEQLRCGFEGYLRIHAHLSGLLA